MADKSNDRWGRSGVADQRDQPWYAPPGVENAADDYEGPPEWSSPSLGSYNPDKKHDALQHDDVAHDAYFDTYGYGEGFGDGRFEGGLGDDSTEEDYDGLFASSETRRNLIEWAVVLMGAVLLAFFLRAVLVQAFWIPTGSMETTLLIEDRVLVNKLSYQFGEINRGDIVVFHRTESEIEQDPGLHEEVIKRVIAFEGETIEIRDNTVFIDGQKLIEPYLGSNTVNADFEPTTVPAGTLFVMGDNRQGSADSRSELGPIGEDRVVGRAFLRFWPLNRVGAL